MTISAFIDTPGPRGRRRQRIATVVATALVVLVLVVAFRRLQGRGQLDGARWKIFSDRGVWEFYLRGFGQTLKAGVVGAFLALTLGLALAFGRLARSAPIRWLSIVYVETLRAVPLVLLMFFALLGLPKLGLDLGPFWSVVAGLTAYNAAVLAEIVRAGILAMPYGQTEAAHSIGLRYWQTMRLVILPQALRAMIPALASQLVVLLKDTSLGALVGYEELLRRAQITGEFSRSPLQALTVAALFFALVIFGLNHLARRLERRRPSVALAGDLPVDVALVAGTPLGAPG